MRIRTAIIAVALMCAVTALLVMGPRQATMVEAAKKSSSKEPKLDEKKQKDIMKIFQTLFEHRYPPEIQKVTVGAAKAGKPIAITVTAGHSSKAKDTVKEVKVYYSTDNGKKWKRPIKLKKSGSAWKGNIPKQKKGKLLYYVYVEDSHGNVAVEAPCKITKWHPGNDKCMVPGAIDAAPKDDKSTRIAKDVDIWNIKVGMNSTYIYVQQNVEGTISQGKISPPNMNAYITIMLDESLLDEFNSFEAMTSMFQQAEKDPAMQKKMKAKENLVWAMIYSPLMAKQFLGSSKSCGAIRAPEGKGTDDKPAMPKIDTTNAECKKPKKSPNLYFKLKKSATGGNMKNEVIILGGVTFTVKKVPDFKMGDITRLTRLTWNPRTITVK